MTSKEKHLQMCDRLSVMIKDDKTPIEDVVNLTYDIFCEFGFLPNMLFLIPEEVSLKNLNAVMPLYERYEEVIKFEMLRCFYLDVCKVHNVKNSPYHRKEDFE